jgi:undecaprenyl diphosphate synthase
MGADAEVTAAPSEQELLAHLDRTRLPRHVAVIMDGNRRWAQERHLPAVFGHRAGVKAFRLVMETCREFGIEALTAYAFSVENWRRSETEVRVLMQLFEQYTRAERDKMVRTGIRFQTLGRWDELPESVRREFDATAQATAHNSAMTLNLAVNYGGRDELVRAAQALLRRGVDPDQVTEESFGRELDTSGQPDPDLLIRTSGEVRLSNFLLWQTAYTELYFTPLYWPQITRRVLLEAFIEFQRRVRRYGGG